MLLLSNIRQDPEGIKKRLQLRRFSRPELIDEFIRLDDKRKRIQQERDEFGRKMNQLSEATGSFMREGRREEGEKLKSEVTAIKKSLEELPNLKEIEEEIQSILYQVPNIPSERVPPGNSAEENEFVRGMPEPGSLEPWALPHWDLAKKYALIDFELGNKITGSGFPVYTHRGARLQRALVQYFLDYNVAAGYTEYAPPFLVNETSATGTGQLPDKEGQMYYVGEDGFYLIPTAEVPLTNIYRDTIIPSDNLPARMTAYTPCFRREAGSYGKDVRGLNRLHQFDKVEIVQLVRPENSYEVLEEMVSHVEKLVQSLDLPYRILLLCAGDLGFTPTMTYDFEVFSAAQRRWLEVSSVSNFETYQTHRIKARFKDASGKNQLLHSLNGSALALPRILACLLENHQTREGISLPKVLHAYYGGNSIS
jgi:seryl-tRNA synthetase